MDLEKKLWTEWRNQPSSKNTEAILNLVYPRISYVVSKFSNSGIPESVLRVRAKAIALEQIKTFNPAYGASLSTHVANGLQKMTDWVDSEKDVVRIPNNIKRGIPSFINEKSSFLDEYGRHPTTVEMADRLKTSVDVVSRMENIINRKEIGESSSMLEPAYSIDSKEHKGIMIRYYDIKDEKERLVYEYTFGLFGKPRLQVSDISRKVSIPEHTVRRMQKRNAQIIQGFLS